MKKRIPCRLVATVVAMVLGTVISGCPRHEDASSPTGGTVPVRNISRDATATGAFQNTDPWQLSTTNADAARGNHGIYLSNGTIGATFGKSGCGDATSVLYRAGVYDEKEVLKLLPAGHAASFAVPKPSETYKQTLTGTPLRRLYRRLVRIS